MTIPETRDRILEMLKSLKLLVPIGHGLSDGARAEIQRDLDSTLDVILAGFEVDAKAEGAREMREQCAQWQPIETAPKGIPILVNFSQIGVWEVRWSTEAFDDGFWCVSDNKNEDRPLRGWTDNPTHWMPLPHPPTVALRASLTPEEKAT